ncbi:MAG TPA: pyridoxal phosphate-dependent aminotransferase, partial [Gammaproteobacteria bacterium]|nr:pyridoxal phosphate-dependent aminotransferase [Gammaproteobacteria bacterium]
AAIEAIKAGKTKYTAVDGTPGLKQAIIHKFKKENQLDYQANQILVSCGAKHSFSNLFQALLNPGDEVIIPAPYWVSYPDMVKLADATPIIIQADINQHFKITPQQLEKHINTKTKLFILNSPSNPTGVAYSQQELAALGEILLQHPNVIIATDDIYEHILWSQDKFCNIVNACPKLYDRTVVINGVSKVYAMTGWRIGYAAGPAELIGAMKKHQSQNTSGPNSIAQAAAEAALIGDQHCVGEMVKVFQQRHDYLYQELKQLNGIECIPAQGTFYLFPNITQAMRNLNLESDIAFASQLIEKQGVAIVPGTAFGAPGHLRFSYATSLDVLREAVKRLRIFLEPT